MIALWLVPVAAFIILSLAYGLTFLFRNQRQPHTHTPADWGLDYDEVHFPTENGKSLYGWWVPAAITGDAKVLILVHGWSRNVERVLPYIRLLHPLGFHILAFDARHHGSSDTDGFSSMVKFAEDIRAAVRFVIQQHGAQASRVGVLGLSVGGAAAILAASQEPRIGAVVSIGAFSHPKEAMAHLLRQRGIRPNPLTALAFRYMEWRIGARFDDIAPQNRVSLIRCPVLLIHGEQDRLVPVEHAHRIFAAAVGQQARLWVVPGKGHSDCHSHPEFEDRLRRFLLEHFEPRRHLEPSCQTDSR